MQKINIVAFILTEIIQLLYIFFEFKYAGMISLYLIEMHGTDLKIRNQRDSGLLAVCLLNNITVRNCIAAVYGAFIRI